MRSSIILAVTTFLGLCRVTLAGSPPASQPAASRYELDLLISGRTITATPVAGCTFASVSGTCHPSGPCGFLLDRTGLLGPKTPYSPRFSVLVDPDGIHAVFTCHAPACTFAFPAGQNTVDVRRLTQGKSTSGPLKAHAVVNAPTTP